MTEPVGTRRGPVPEDETFASGDQANGERWMRQPHLADSLRLQARKAPMRSLTMAFGIGVLIGLALNR